MAVSVTHTTAATGVDSADGKISKNAWNATHTVDATTLPGYEFDYAQITSPVTITATTEATATTCITGGAVTYDGSTIIRIEVFAPYTQNPPNSQTDIWLYDGSSSIGRMAIILDQQASADQYAPLYAVRRLTPSAAAHTYSIRVSRTNPTTSFGAGAGGAGTHPPAFLRITRV